MRQRRVVLCPSCGQWARSRRCDWCDHPLDDPAGAHAITREVGPLRLLGIWVYIGARGLLHVDVREHLHLLRYLGKWTALGVVVGVMAGCAAAVFLIALAWATSTRGDNPWLLAVLPVAGFTIGLAYHYLGGRAGEGNNLIIDAIHGLRHRADTAASAHHVPLRMAPMVLIGTVVTHLFGGSAGREGTGIQMSSSLTDAFARAVRLAPGERRLLLIASIAGGFGAVFQVPMAGTVFALESTAVGRVRFEALVPSLAAAVTGDRVVEAIFVATGLPHAPTPTVRLEDVPLEPLLLVKVALAGLAFALAAVLFSELTYGLRRIYRVAIRWAPARPVAGGVVVIGLTVLVGTTDYLGLSLPLIADAYAGEVVAWAFLGKIVFTAATVGAGFPGGEVTPLFVVGATLGGAMAGGLDVPPELLAAVGLVAVFAGATNTPLACTLMGVELFGSGAFVHLAIGCVVSYVFSGHRGIYETQRIDTAKGEPTIPGDTQLRSLIQRRRLWLPHPGGRESGRDDAHDGDDHVGGR